MIKHSTLVVLAVLVLLVSDFQPGSQHAAQPQSQDPEYVSGEIIVRFRDGVDEYRKDLARFRVSGTRKRAFRSFRGMEVITLRGVSVKEAIEIYKQDPDVLYAEPNYIVTTTNIPNDPRFGDLWGLHNIGQSGGTLDADIDAPEAWNQTTGSSDVIVAVIDSGVDYNHLDLSANMFRNIADCNNNGIDDDGNGYVDDCYGIDTRNNDSDPMDDNNHGTHVAGTIGAVGNNSLGVVGINWNIQIIACKFVSSAGSGTIEAAIGCLEYVKIMKDRGYNIVATNNSWGGGGFSQALFDAIDAHRQRGILFITAAGNGDFFGFPINNDQTPFYPCTYYLPNVICVASTTRTDSRSFFSNYGRRTVHIGAPGSEILSTVRGNSYSTSSGTSMATPHVTGVAALLKAQNPDWDWRAIKNLILAGGDNIDSMANTVTQKRLNAHGALTCSNSTVLSRLRPIPDTVAGSVGIPIDLAVVHTNCANPNGNITVTVDPGEEIITLVDDGIGPDQASGDGIYSGQWAPPAEGSYTLTFSSGDIVKVAVNSPLLTVTPSSQDFGTGNVNSSVDKNFTIKNDGVGTLTGTASTEAPYSIVSGGSYSLDAGQSQTATVRFAPTSAGTFLGNVNFTGGGGFSAPVSGTAVIPPNLAMSFDGQVSDRVGQGDAALGPDGKLDGVFTVTIQAGSGNRTVTSLDLRRSNPTAGWDTEPNTVWVLGAAHTLTGPLLNDPNNGTRVNFEVLDGGSFNIFASDNVGLFSDGATLTLTAKFADGSTATASAALASPPAPASLAMSFDGKLSDRVGQGDKALGPDGKLDGVFTVTLQAGSGNRTVTSLDLRRSNPTAGWDTEPNKVWVLGAAITLTDPLLNDPNNGTRVHFEVLESGSFKIFASDSQKGGLFVDGAIFTLTAKFADGTTATASASVASPPTVAMDFDGQVSDRVGQGDAALSPDGKLDGVFSVTLVSGGNRTVSSLDLRRSNPKAGWDTEPNKVWVLGAANTLTDPLLNDPNNGTRVNFEVLEGGSFRIFVSDNVGLFTDGATFTLTVSFTDGSAAAANATVPLVLTGK